MIGWKYEALATKDLFELLNQPGTACPLVFLFKLLWLGILLFAACSVQALSHVWLLATSWTVACQASLSITNSRSLLKLMSIESVMLSSHLILCRPLLLLSSIFPGIRSLPMSHLFAWGGQSIGVSASASVLPMNTQDWSPLGLTGLISLHSKGLKNLFQHHSSKASILRR